MQVFLVRYQSWADIIEETDDTIVAMDIDGVMTYVTKDDSEMTRAIAQ